MIMSPEPMIAGVVLAAGCSQRFAGRRSKLLAELGGEPLVRRVVQAALDSRLRQILVVLGHAAAELRLELADLDVEWVENPAFARGQSTSVRAGLERIAPSMQAAMFLPGDQPFVSSRLIDRLIRAHIDSGRQIVRPKATGGPGAPVLWDRSLFGELGELAGDIGGRELLKRHVDRVIDVEAEDPLELADVDTVEDLRQLEMVLRSSHPMRWKPGQGLI